MNNNTYNNAYEFFDKIKSHCSSNEEYIIELLKARGFLLDIENGNTFFSDNAHVVDAHYLKDILKNYNLGKLKDGVLIINQKANAKAYEESFVHSELFGAPYEGNDRTWSWFKNRIHGKKYPVEFLEHYIARYVKAISACGVYTVSSCDGNHDGLKRAHILVEHPGSKVWHKAMWVNCLYKLFEINWDEEYLAFSFPEKDRYNTYYKINRAAAFIYDHRLCFRQIKKNAFADISASYLRHSDDFEIEERFYGNVSVLLKDWAKTLKVE